MDTLKICVNCITASMCSTRNAVDLISVCRIFKEGIRDCGHNLKHFEEKYVDAEGIHRQFRLRRTSGSELVLYDMFVDDIDFNSVIIRKDGDDGHRHRLSFTVL